MPFEIPLTSPAKEWPDAVRSALSQIATVSNVEIEMLDGMLEDTAAIAEGEEADELPDDNERPWFWPEPDFTSVTFDIHIPKRMQPELSVIRTAGAEDFRVRTVYGYHGPCTFVSVLSGDDPDEVSPSSAVVIVHRYLTRELERQGGLLRMARVGPSPFHMEAELISGPKDQVSPLVFQRLGRAGYEHVRFIYSPLEYSTLDEAEAALQGSLQGQLELFYYMRRLAYIRRDEARALQASTSELVAKHSLTGPKGWFTRLFSTASQARKLGLQALDLQTRAAQLEDGFEEWTRDTLAQSDALPVFEDAIREIAAEDDSALMAHANEVVRFVESGRRSEFEVLMLSAATLLGGLAGGVVGLLVAAGGGGA